MAALSGLSGAVCDAGKRGRTVEYRGAEGLDSGSPLRDVPNVENECAGASQPDPIESQDFHSFVVSAHETRARMISRMPKSWERTAS